MVKIKTLAEKVVAQMICCNYTDAWLVLSFQNQLGQYILASQVLCSTKPCVRQYKRTIRKPSVLHYFCPFWSIFENPQFCKPSIHYFFNSSTKINFYWCICIFLFFLLKNLHKKALYYTFVSSTAVKRNGWQVENKKGRKPLPQYCEVMKQAAMPSCLEGGGPGINIV